MTRRHSFQKSPMRFKERVIDWQNRFLEQRHRKIKAGDVGAHDSFSGYASQACADSQLSTQPPVAKVAIFTTDDVPENALSGNREMRSREAIMRASGAG